MALYNKMRPKGFGEVKGQDKIVEILKNNIRSNNLPNAMLFIGTRGIGKTTIAKIVARMLNCEHPLADGDCCDACSSCKQILAGTSLDVMELDAASNNGVDSIREIIESVQYKPIGKMKIVILDEVHMLSNSAFNALLKTMEEPPKNVLFILCTTELHKVPATIISRCRKFQFEMISVDTIVSKLKRVNELLCKEAEEEALYLVAKAANGSMRDAESIYEAFLDTDGLITTAYVRSVLGFSEDESVFSILDAIIEANPVKATAVIDEVFERGGSLNFLLEECMHTLMDIISIKMSGDITDKSNSPQYLEKVSEYAFSLESQRLFEIMDAFCKTYSNKTADKLLSFQAMLIELACTQSTITLLLEKVAVLEKTVAELSEKGVCVKVSADSAATEMVSSREETDVDRTVCGEDLKYEGDCPPFPDADYSAFISETDYHTAPEDFIPIAEDDMCNIPFVSSDPNGDDELRALGLNVVSQAPVFEEETLDDTTLASECTLTGEEQAVSVTEQFASDGAQTEGVSGEVEASFFDEFARLFGI